MQFHHRGYVSEDPRIKPAAGYGINRPTDIPDAMDVLIVGTGPAAVTVAAQLSHFPSINVRIIERREGRLTQGQADGIQARSVETFQAFGFANAIVDEAYRNVEMCFWKPDDKHPENIMRVSRVPDDAHGRSWLDQARTYGARSTTGHRHRHCSNKEAGQTYGSVDRT